MAKLLIFGSGAIGCYLGGQLLAHGHDVDFLGRTRLKDALKDQGLTLTGRAQTPLHIQSDRINYVTSVDEVSDCEIVLVTVKSQDSLAASKALNGLAKRLKPQRPLILVSLQNGIGNLRLFRENLSTDFDVFGGMVPFNVTRTEETTFHCGTSGSLVLERNPKTATLLEALASTAIDVSVTDDIVGLQWSKLLLNLNNAVNALSGLPLRQQILDPKFRKILSLAIMEGLTVARRLRIDLQRVGPAPIAIVPGILRLPTPVFRVLAQAMIKIDPKARSSMWEDLSQKKSTEIDYLNGEVVKAGREVGFPTPVNSKIVSLVKTAEQAQLGSPEYDGQRLSSLVGC
jgi:2-dehydropantoate 2-reductase